jgi:hypothetical protein
MVCVISTRTGKEADISTVEPIAYQTMKLPVC